jgi:hypothetical protein
MTYLASIEPDPQLAHYYPAWLDHLADTVTIEGSMMDGFVQGPEGVRKILLTIRGIYDYQKFSFAGPFGEHGWLEDYVAGVQGEPIGNFTIVNRNADGQTVRVVGNYRPRSTVLLLSRLVGEQLQGTPYAEHFLASE